MVSRFLPVSDVAVYRENIMLNPYAPPSDPIPQTRADATLDARSIAIPFSLALVGSALAAAALVLVHHFSLPIDKRNSALTMAGVVTTIQFLASAQITRQLQTRSIPVSQTTNGLSWLAVIGVLGISHYILSSVPELRWLDVSVFVGLGCASALLSVLACYVAKLWR
jgi:predicted membrane channel-forming protein YqfA (hemolysin III family)